ncbi:DUF6531 domain-containing protein, partial [Gammaproteobacteria bacterium]|nr:DUF6531 domain-containing protein [Gammaproteobacteria bacterium]
MNYYLFPEAWGFKGKKCNASSPRVATTIVLYFCVCILSLSINGVMNAAHGDQDVFICVVSGTMGFNLPYDRYSSGDPKPACEASAESHIPGECKLVPVFNTITRLLRRVRAGECSLDSVNNAYDFGRYNCPMRYVDCNNGSFWGGQDYGYTYQLVSMCPDGNEIDPLTGDCEPPPVCPAGQVRKRGQCIVPPVCSGVGNPCDAATGNKSQTETDYAADVAGIGLTRTYNSAQSRNIGFGVGWTSSLAKRLIINGEELRVQRGNGWQDPFSRQEGVWQGDADTDFLIAEDAGGFEVTLPNGDLERYDAGGRLLFETSTSGLTTTYNYDQEDHLMDITSPYGHKMSLAYDDTGQIIAVTDPADRSYNYTYDSNDNLVEVQYPDGSTREYHYEDAGYPNHLTGITDANGGRFAIYAYDDEGRAISTGHARTDGASPQERYQLDYTGTSGTVVTDPIGELWDYNYQQNLGLHQLISRTSRSDARGVVQQFDANNNLVARTDEEERTTTYTYNATNQKTSTTVAVGSAQERTTFYEYIAPDIDLPTRVSTPSVLPGSVREVLTSYDDKLNVTRVTTQGFDPVGNVLSRVTSFEYDGRGRVTQIDGPHTDVDDITTMTYNDCDTGAECGHLTQVVNALGHITTFDTYDAYGRLTRSTDTNGMATTRSYDLRGRLTSIVQTPPVGAARITAFGYDGVGQITSVVTPDEIILTYSYDAAHDLRSITDNLGNKIEYAYDLKGNRIQEDTRDPDGTLVRTIQTTYDLRDRSQSVNAAGSITQTLWDAVGNLLVETDPNLNPGTFHSYDALNRLTRTLDALAYPTAYQYDERDNLKAVTAPNGAVTAYEYDDLGNLLKETSPDRGVTTYTHDASGNVVTITDARNNTATYVYDALNRAINIDYPGTEHDQIIEYDTCSQGFGRLCGTIDESGATKLEYDSFGNVLTHIKVEDGQSLATHYQYDAGDRVEQIIYPHGGAVNYGRDTLGRIADINFNLDGRIVPVLSQRRYRADGLATSQILGNGLAETRRYDQQGRLIEQTVGAIDSRTYQYDANGNQLARDQITFNGPAPATATFTYDVLDRITEDAGPEGIFAFTYDGNRNRLTRTKDANVKTYQYAALSNRTTEANNKAVVIDAAGNTTSDRNGNRTYRYDATGRLESFNK